MKDAKYVVVVQWHIVKERCSGYLCEHAFTERNGAFSRYKETAKWRNQLRMKVETTFIHTQAKTLKLRKTR